MSKSEMTIAWESFDEQSLKPALDQKIESVKAFGEESRIYTEATTRLCSIAGFSAGWKAALKHADPIHAQLVEALRWALEIINKMDQGFMDEQNRQKRYDAAVALLADIDRSPVPVAGGEAGKS